MNYFFEYTLLFILTLVLSLLLVPLFRIIARKLEIMDEPDERKIHSSPVPYLGGAAIYAAFVLGVIITTFIYRWIDTRSAMLLLISSFIIFLLGLVDDIRGANVKLKFLVQIAVAVFVVSNGISLTEITNPIGGGTIELGFAGKVISVLWIVSISNAINLLDGLDGLAGGVSAIAIIFMTAFAVSTNDIALAALMLGLLGGIIGFLFYNFPPASIFMGDLGSLVIGFLFSVFCLKANSKGPYTITIIIPAMLLTIPIFDTLLAIIRRAKKGTGIFTSDKEHLHHRILALGKSYKKTLLLIYLINIVIGLIATTAFLLPNKYRFILIFILAQDILFGLFILHLFEKKNYWQKKAS